MPGLAHALLIGAVVLLVIDRQVKAQRIDADRRRRLIPAVLVFMAVREPDLAIRPTYGIADAAYVLTRKDPV
ncbi:hypothetical protein ACOBQB_08420 [Streptomyces sp. G5(2025)]|uniref:hypothetical protein n=1 Tax=Streptomyces sp. G5(2025) TaxID=3406628 RepID=UPI003C16CDD2